MTPRRAGWPTLIAYMLSPLLVHAGWHEAMDDQPVRTHHDRRSKEPAIDLTVKQENLKDPNSTRGLNDIDLVKNSKGIFVAQRKPGCERINFQAQALLRTPMKIWTYNCQQMTQAHAK